ncbi:MAG: oligosaccharide flippase family protein [Flavobacterium sp.]
MVKEKINGLIRDKNKRNFFIYGLGQSFNLLSPLLVAPLIISVCGVDSFGKVGLGFALTLFLILIVDYSFDIKGTKQIAENRHDLPKLEKILNTAIFTKIVLLLISLSIAVLLITFIPFFSQEKPLFFISLIIVIAQAFNPVWFLQGIENFTLVSILNICSKTVYVLLLFCFITKKSDYIFVNFFLGFSSLVFNVLGLVIIKNKLQFKIIRPAYSEVKEILVTDLSFCISQLFLSARQLSPLVLCGYFLGFTIAGYYKILEQVITLFRTFVQVFLKFFYPRVCYKFVINKTDGFAFWKKYTTFNIGFVFVSLLIIFIFSEAILRFFHLTESSVNEMSFVFRFSLLVSFMMAFSLPLEQLMFVMNKNRYYIRITIFVTIINIITLVLLIKTLEVNGIVISLLISEMLFISLYSYNSYLKVK